MSDPRFWAVSASESSPGSALFWTRYGGQPSDLYQPPEEVDVLLELSLDPAFDKVAVTTTGRTKAGADGTAKLLVDGLESGSTYYYRFSRDSGAEKSAVGIIRTSPDVAANAALKLGFGGCANGRYAPFSAVNWSGSDNPDLDLFVMLGDAAYGNKISWPRAISLSATPNPFAVEDLQTVVQSIWTKQLLNLSTISVSDGKTELVPGGLSSLYASQSVLAVPDNKDLADNFLEAGGAPLTLVKLARQDEAIANREGTDNPAFFSTDLYYKSLGRAPEYARQSSEFLSIFKAFTDYQPIGDQIGGGTPVLYGVKAWGRNNRIITLDDRTYRDVKLTDQDDDDVTVVSGDGADSKNRTILGATQFEWLKQQLLAAKADGVLWTVINISSPIDALGAPGSDQVVEAGGTSVDAKSWWGNYRYERNELLKFIVNSGLRNVVFLAADDHEARVNEVVYSPNADSSDPAALTKNLVAAPGVFTVVSSPIGAARPSGFVGADLNSNPLVGGNFMTPMVTKSRRGTEYVFNGGFVELAQTFASNQKQQGVDPVGLSPNYPGLISLDRSTSLFDDHPVYQADVRNPQPQDFWSPQTYNWGELDIDEQGLLKVSAFGVNAYNEGKGFENANARSEMLFSFELAPSINWGSTVELVGQDSLKFQGNLPFVCWRADTNEGEVSFGLVNGEGAGFNLLSRARAGEANSLNPGNVLDSDPLTGWLATEGRSVGSTAAVSHLALANGTWIPTAERNGQKLNLQGLKVEGSRVTADFEFGVKAVLSLNSTSPADAPPEMRPLMSIQRLGAFRNGLAFYEIDDPITGAVGALLPGSDGYLSAALARADEAKTVLTPEDMPDFGRSLEITSLNLDTAKSYGVLLLVQGSRSTVYSSFADANPGREAHMLHMGSDSTGYVIGIEDLGALTPSGRLDWDHNDVIVHIDSAVLRIV